MAVPSRDSISLEQAVFAYLFWFNAGQGPGADT